ncbi:ScbR family autoregulator-binding transcription factor [Streptomyces sp. NPDC051018]|uniref:ScbR family autoregulator-binding transcription factor n=1 Tax=Streptomyces sp. NPDC051018 TaxID=3365639 RepID=UPI00378FA5DA
MMRRQSDRGMQQRAVETRGSILLAAAEVFDEFGFAGASISKICERGGTTQGAIYFHFASKEGLAREVMLAQPTVIVPRLATEGLQRLVDITLVWSRQLQSSPLLRAGVRLVTEQRSFGLNDIRPYEVWVGIMEEILVTAGERGDLRESVDPRRLAEYLVASCTGVQMYSYVVAGREDLTERATEMWRFLLPGVAAEQVAQLIDASTERADQLEILPVE